jgi:hypothetical protein
MEISYTSGTQRSRRRKNKPNKSSATNTPNTPDARMKRKAKLCRSSMLYDINTGEHDMPVNNTRGALIPLADMKRDPN